MDYVNDVIRADALDLLEREREGKRSTKDKIRSTSQRFHLFYPVATSSNDNSHSFAIITRQLTSLVSSSATQRSCVWTNLEHRAENRPVTRCRGVVMELDFSSTISVASP